MSVCFDFLTYIAYIAYFTYYTYFAYYLYYFYMFQRVLMTETKLTTGKSSMKGQATVYPSEQTAGTKVRPLALQIPSSQAAISQAFESTFGTEPRFDASLHTLCLEVAVTTWVSML